MRIVLDLQDADPPTGTAMGEDGTTVRFGGWLELLQAISSLEAVTLSAASPGNESGELDA